MPGAETPSSGSDAEAPPEEPPVPGAETPSSGSDAEAPPEEASNESGGVAGAYADLVACRDDAHSRFHFYFCPNIHDKYVLAVTCVGDAGCEVLNDTDPFEEVSGEHKGYVVGLASSTGSADYNLRLADLRSEGIGKRLASKLGDMVSSYAFGEVHPFNEIQSNSQVSSLKKVKGKCDRIAGELNVGHFSNQRVDVFLCNIASPTEGNRMGDLESVGH